MTSPLRPDPLFSKQFCASDAAVRILLAELRKWLTNSGLDEDICGSVEIVMAEALNNIVEHAYSGAGKGLVDVSVTQQTAQLSFTIRDEGQPMPDLRLPDNQLPDANGPLADLPEGGFGWFLIHHLTHQLSYERQDDQNLLCFTFTTNNFGKT